MRRVSLGLCVALLTFAFGVSLFVIRSLQNEADDWNSLLVPPVPVPYVLRADARYLEVYSTGCDCWLSWDEKEQRYSKRMLRN